MAKKNMTILGGEISVHLDGKNAPIVLGTTDGDVTLELEKDEKVVYTGMTGPKTIYGKRTLLTSVMLKGTIVNIDKDIYEMAFGGDFKEKTFKKDDIYFDGKKLTKEKKVSFMTIGEDIDKTGSFAYHGINTDPSAVANPALYIPSGYITVVNPFPLSSNEAVTLEFVIQSQVTSKKDKPVFVLEPIK